MVHYNPVIHVVFARIWTLKCCCTVVNNAFEISLNASPVAFIFLNWSLFCVNRMENSTENLTCFRRFFLFHSYRMTFARCCGTPWLAIGHWHTSRVVHCVERRLKLCIYRQITRIYMCGVMDLGNVVCGMLGYIYQRVSKLGMGNPQANKLALPRK